MTDLPPWCEAKIYVRDTYRVCRDGKRWFRVHYRAKRCARRVKDKGLCWQHLALLNDGRQVERYEWP